MKRKKNHSPQRSDIADLVRRVQDYKPAKGDFNYAERGRAVKEAHQLYNESFQLGKVYPMVPDLSEASTKAHRLWYEAVDNAYPPGFWNSFQQLCSGNSSGLESAVSFLEADPLFYRTGYVKTKLIRYIKPQMLTPEFDKRLQQVVLFLVDRRDDRDFRAYCRLACKVDTPELRELLTQRINQGNFDVRRRARWMLEALAQKDRMERAKKAQDRK